MQSKSTDRSQLYQHSYISVVQDNHCPQLDGIELNWSSRWGYAFLITFRIHIGRMNLDDSIISYLHRPSLCTHKDGSKQKCAVNR